MIKLLESQNTAEVADRFAAEKFQLTLTERDSTCTITVGPTAPEINVGAWLQDEDEPGAGIVWRVRSVQTDYKTQTRTILCEHAIMALKDFLLFGEVTPAVITGLENAETCTADETFRYILSHQSIWRFGSVLYNDTQAYNFNGDDLYTAMETITATIPNAWWSYDFSRVPYVISVVEKPESYIGQLSELRMDRNMKSLSVTVDRSRMYTRFYPIGRNNLMLPELYVGRNENLYGVSSQTETDENRTTEADLRKWANERLDNHAEPQVTVSVNAMDLSAITGEDLDNFVLGAHCTVALPEYGTTIYERITTLQWPDKVRDPMGVTITMANQKQDLTKILSKEKKKTSTGRRSSAVSVSKSLKDVTLSGPTNNTYTLTKVLTNGKTEQIGTFSRAVTSWVVDVPTGGTIRVTAKPQDQSKSIQIGQGAGSWDGNTYSGLITYSDDDEAHWFSSGKWFTVDATARYNAGWTAARGKVVLPVTTDTAHNSIVVKVPSATVGSQEQRTYYMGSKDNNHAGLYTMVGEDEIEVAELSHGKYNAGWGAARAKVVLKTTEDTSHNDILIKVPSSTVGETESRDYYLGSKDNNHVGLYTMVGEGSEATEVEVAEITHGKYNAGWAAARSKVELKTTADTAHNDILIKVPSTTVGETESRDYYMGSKDDNHVGLYTMVGEGAEATEVEVAEWTHGKYNAGWGAARAKVELKTTADTAHNDILIKVPAAIVGQTESRDYYMGNEDDNHVGLYTMVGEGAEATEVEVAEWTHGKYNAGWGAARAKVELKTTTDTAHNDILIKVPSQTVGQTESRDYYMASKDNNHVGLYTMVEQTEVEVAEVTHGKYNQGWEAARVKCSWPTTADTAHNSITIYIPDSTVGDRTSRTYYMASKDDNHVGLYTMVEQTEVEVAEWTHGKYNAGWTAAYNKMVLPVTEDTAHNSITIYFPDPTVGNTASRTYYMGSKDNNHVGLYTMVSGTEVEVAEWTHGKYNAGWTAAYNKMVMPVTADTAHNSITIYFPDPNVDSTASRTYYMGNAGNNKCGLYTMVNGVETEVAEQSMPTIAPVYSSIGTVSSAGNLPSGTKSQENGIAQFAHAIGITSGYLYFRVIENGSYYVFYGGPG